MPLLQRWSRQGPLRPKDTALSLLYTLDFKLVYTLKKKTYCFSKDHKISPPRSSRFTFHSDPFIVRQEIKNWYTCILNIENSLKSIVLAVRYLKLLFIFLSHTTQKTVHVKFLNNKTNRCTNFPNLFWLKNEPLHVSGRGTARNM